MIAFSTGVKPTTLTQVACKCHLVSKDITKDQRFNCSKTKFEALLISLPKLILTSYAETLLTTDNLAIQKSLIDGTYLLEVDYSPISQEISRCATNKQPFY